MQRKVITAGPPSPVGGMEGWGSDGGGMEEALFFALPEYSRSQSQRSCFFLYNLQQIERVPFSC